MSGSGLKIEFVVGEQGYGDRRTVEPPSVEISATIRSKDEARLAISAIEWMLCLLPENATPTDAAP